MKKTHAISVVIPILLFCACKKELNDSTLQVVESGKPAPIPSTLTSSIFRQCIGTPEVESGSWVSETGDGYYVVGSSNTSDGKTAALISKIGLDGRIIWPGVVHGSEFEEFRNVVTTDDGGCLAIGSTSSSDLKVNNVPVLNKGSRDILLVKFSSSGVQEWGQTIGGTQGENISGIIKTSDAKYVLIGYTNSTDGDITSSLSPRGEIWLVKFSILTGGVQIEWEKKLPGVAGSNSEIGRSIAEGSNGDFMIVANCYFPTPDMLVINTDNVGNVKRTRRIGSVDINVADLGWSIAKSNDNINFVFTGSMGNSTIVRKISPSGDDIWEKSYVLGSARSILSTPDGIVLLGLTSNKTGDVVAKYGGQDLFVVKLNEQGENLKSQSFGGSRSDMGYFMIRTTDYSYVAVGATESNNGLVSGNNGTQDIWAIKFKFN